jgi:hypothetical protein
MEQRSQLIGLGVIGLQTHRLTCMSPSTPLARFGDLSVPASGAIRVMVAKIVTRTPRLVGLLLVP